MKKMDDLDGGENVIQKCYGHVMETPLWITMYYALVGAINCSPDSISISSNPFLFAVNQSNWNGGYTSIAVQWTLSIQCVCTFGCDVNVIGQINTRISNDDNIFKCDAKKTTQEINKSQWLDYTVERVKEIYTVAVADIGSKKSIRWKYNLLSDQSHQMRVSAFFSLISWFLLVWSYNLNDRK